MATVSGNSGEVFVGSNQVAEVKSFDLTETDNIIESTSMGDTSKTFEAGLKEASGTITCHFDKSDSTGQEAMNVGASITLNLYPEGNSTGNREITFTAQITSVGVSEAINEIVERSFGFTADGAVTHGTVA
jgi:hypothetical protein